MGSRATTPGRIKKGGFSKGLGTGCRERLGIAATNPAGRAQETRARCAPDGDAGQHALRLLNGAPGVLARAASPPVPKFVVICYSALRWTISGLPGVTRMSPPVTRIRAASFVTFLN